ncbi:hypothetical protein QYE76_067697 [Lolium multiflorum]|uniref:Pentatricopeptide repeat-containing protein n=1 Tax=Lolium multiflorum TaxID=4521 RepID=A0AAD8WD86_LOLMU|nr:hypothetical protein QYE76_067697 [Lolium multiflorum]
MDEGLQEEAQVTRNFGEKRVKTTKLELRWAPLVGLHLRELPVPRLGPASLPRHGRSGVDMHGRVRRRGRAGTAQSNHMDGTDRRVCVYAQNGRVKESLEFYAEMVPSGCMPDYGTFIRRSSFCV